MAWMVTVVRTHARTLVGQTCYRPFYRERKLIRGRRVYVERPLFGRYLLVRMFDDWISQFYARRKIPVVLGVLLRDEKPMVARDDEVEQLKMREVRGYVELPKLIRFYKDQRVTISRGPFLNTEGRFKREKGALDVVELELFGSGPRRDA
jgi:transcription antitermination factor NusG